MPDEAPRARQQLDSVWHDPRLERDDLAFIADYHDYLFESDRVRWLAIRGIEALADAATPERIAPDRRQFLDEQRELAAAYIATEHAHLNAITLAGMVGNLESLVERLAPTYAALRSHEVSQAVEGTGAGVPIADPPAHEVGSSFRAVAAAVSRSKRKRSVFGPAPGRWEQELAKAGLGEDSAHPIPQAMMDALAEAVSLRHVLLHRGARLDEHALTQAPTLIQAGFEVGKFIRLDRKTYQRYVAALRCYGLELHRRVFRGVPQMSEAFAVDLAKWETYGIHYG